MIITDDHVSKALHYLSDDPHPIALARKAVTDAENKAKRIYAGVFLDAVGSVDARKATAETHPDYANAKDEESMAIFNLERHKARVRAAEMVIEVWRTESANVRAAESIR